MAGIKLTLIKRIETLVSILTITALAISFILWNSNVSESQEPTYSPEVDWSETATTTQPDATASSTEETVEESTIETVVPVYGFTPPVSSPEKERVVELILQTFPEEPVMVYVAMCESGLDPLADREHRNVDVGLFQINQVHLPRVNALGLDRRDLYDNLTFARMLYDESGLNPWYMSEHCWSKYL